MRRRVPVLLLAVLLLAAPARAQQPVDEALFKKIEANLMCTDGCGMYLAACDNSFAEKMRADIRQKLSEGASEKEIYAYMVSVYGPEALAAPPTDHPLNVAAWVLPFMAILGGGLAIYLVVDRWVFNRRAERGTAEQPDPGVSAEYEALLDAEVKKYF